MAQDQATAPHHDDSAGLDHEVSQDRETNQIARTLAADRGRNPLVPPPPAGRTGAAATAWLVRRLAARVPIQVSESATFAPGSEPKGSPTLYILRPERFYSRIRAHGLIGFGEAYQAGDWDTDDLPALLAAILKSSDGWFLSNIRRLRRYFGGARRPGNVEYTIDGARDSISHHYDISNDFFECILDETMTYSAALFSTDTTGSPIADTSVLADAQIRKIDRLLDLTNVGNETRLLEIGTGWGSLAIRAAQRGARVHTITISAEQHAYTQRKIDEAGMTGKVKAELRDYRELDTSSEKYDAIISVEMIEAVGEQYWSLYLSLLDNLLAPAGKIGLQIITMRHDRFLLARHTQSWTNKYVLPGFLLPSPQAIEAAIAMHTSLEVLDKLAFGPHFEATLRLWREHLTQYADRIANLGLDEAFLRTWRFFLANGEAGFRANHFDIYHYILGRRI